MGVLSAHRGPDHEMEQRRPPAGGRIAVGDDRGGVGGVDRLGAGGRGVVHRRRRRPHQRPVARRATRVAFEVGRRRPLPAGRRVQNRAGLDPDVGRALCPHTEPLEQVGPVDTAAVEQRFGLDDRHLGVVGELTGRPRVAPAADHLADTTDDRFGEPARVLPRFAELERRAERIAHRRTHDRPECPLTCRTIPSDVHVQNGRRQL